MDDDDPFGSYGLRKVHLEDKPLFDLHFSTGRSRLSDYTFANTFIWRDSIHLRWKVIRDCLCVFANGDGGLTMLFPPVGEGDINAAVGQCVALCDDYNAAAHLDQWTRIEYVGQETLEKLPAGDFSATAMSGDYVYSTARMIDLAGGDLASKRQARNRFARRYEARTEPFEPRHTQRCLHLLGLWRQQAEHAAPASTASVQIKRNKEIAATADVIRHGRELGLQGMVLYAGGELVGFTFGELMDEQTCSILVEKTDRNFVGSANYIFSEFCRQYWAATTWCNVGDDWEVPSLAWTKQSYRPAMRLPKWVLRPLRSANVVPPINPAAGQLVEALQPPAASQGHCPEAQRRELAMQPAAAATAPQPVCDRAGLGDLEVLCRLEAQSFDGKLALSRRQLRYLLCNPRASVHVIRRDGKIAAEALLLRRKTRNGVSGRLYSIAVDGAYRGRGLGKLLLTSCLEALKAEGIGTLYLEVYTENLSAVSLYEKLGFKKVRRLVDYYGQGQDGWKMRLDLAPQPVLA